jgi:hypothetical protein
VVGEPIQQGSLIIHILRGPNVGPAISGTSGWWRWWFWCWSIRWGDWRGEESSRRTCSVCQGFCQEERMYVFDSTWHIPNFKLIWYTWRELKQKIYMRGAQYFPIVKAQSGTKKISIDLSQICILSWLWMLISFKLQSYSFSPIFKCLSTVSCLNILFLTRLFSWLLVLFSCIFSYLNFYY